MNSQELKKKTNRSFTSSDCHTLQRVCAKTYRAGHGPFVMSHRAVGWCSHTPNQAFALYPSLSKHVGGPTKEETKYETDFEHGAKSVVFLRSIKFFVFFNVFLKEGSEMGVRWSQKQLRLTINRMTFNDGGCFKSPHEFCLRLTDCCVSLWLRTLLPSVY